MIQEKKKKGFTLVEILVVIALIGLLMGIFMVAIGSSRRNAKIRATKTLLKQLELALSNYQSDFGTYPPSSLKDIGVTIENSKNQGIESLVACLFTQQKNGPYFKDYDSKRLTNYDKDKMPNFNDNLNKSGEALEYTDSWKEVLVYIHGRDYQDYQRVADYMGKKSYGFSIKPAMDPKTKNFFNPTTFQLWSVGPNGKNENGRGDDVTAW
ncbi:MAG: type II secretion system protein [Planctomycetota bacterium]|nr:MAG: type II secretion system protein [Planctomycetota bacterium]